MIISTNLKNIPNKSNKKTSKELTPDFFLNFDFEELIKRTEKRLKNFIKRRIWNPEEVEDIMQSSFLEALHCRNKFRGDSAPETWLFGIAINLMRTHIRKVIQSKGHNFNAIDINVHKYRNGTRSKYLDVDGSSNCQSENLTSNTGEDPCDTLMRYTNLCKIERGFKRLSNNMRAILLLIVEDGASYQEAADQLGVPIGTVRSRLNRARQTLKSYIT